MTDEHRAVASASFVLHPSRIWNGWAATMRNGGCVTHAWSESERRFSAVCGAQLIDAGGHINLESGWEPDCLRCLAWLHKRGLMQNASGQAVANPAPRSHDKTN